jgi:hypothetical protein
MYLHGSVLKGTLDTHRCENLKFYKIIQIHTKLMLKCTLQINHKITPSKFYVFSKL